MEIKEALTAGISGTTFMTVFSCAAAKVTGEDFSEPERLGQLANRIIPTLNKKESELGGWVGHYSVGLAFATAYVALWRQSKLKPSFENDLCVGSISGIIAVGVWKLMFKLHPLPPRLSFSNYYAQLIPAHVVFAIFAGLSYRMLKNERQELTTHEIS